MRPMLKDDTELIIKEFIRQKVTESGGEGVVVGLSGGLDSAVVAALSARAIGPEKVLAIYMPSDSSSAEDLEDAKGLAGSLGIEFKIVRISSAVSALSGLLPSSERKDLLGNVMARCRMIVLFHHANLMGRIVMGTGNKSELLVGYFTKFGDGGSDFLPIGDLYKSEVRELARRIGLPDHIVEKPPSAGLWAGQTDEGEIGVSYEDLDSILLGLELGLSLTEIAERTNMEPELVEMVWSKHLSTVHKRKMPLIPKIGIRTLGLDWRE